MSRNNISTKGHRFKLQTSQFKLDVAKNHFCKQIVCNWNKLPDSSVATDTIVHFNFKDVLCTENLEAALTFNRHLLVLSELDLFLYNNVSTADFATH